MRHLIFGKKYIQTADLNNSLFINNVAQTVTINGTVTRTTDHKGGNTAIQFGSGNLVSVENLPASPVWSIAFWAKTNQTAASVIAELTANYNSKYAFVITQNETVNKIRSASCGTNYKVKDALGININDNTWRHFVVILNRSETGDNEMKIYINKVQQSLSTFGGFNNEQTGSYVSDKIYLGGRGASYQLPFVGATSPFKLFNYPLTQTEIDNLYNE